MQTIIQSASTVHRRLNPPAKKVLVIGYAFLAISSGLYLLSVSEGLSSDSFTRFLVHYMIAVAYVIVLIVHKFIGIRKSWSEQNLDFTAIAIHLFFVSAFALNREVPVFEESVQWLSVYLVITSIAVLSFGMTIRSRWFDRIRFIVCGSALVLYIYLSVYCITWIPIGALGTIVLGIGAHIFVPGALFAVTLLLMKREAVRSTSRLWIVAGAGSTVLFVTAFVTEWKTRVSLIDTITHNHILSVNQDLPAWIKVSSGVRRDWISQRVFKFDFVYTTRDRITGMDFLPVRGRWNEDRYHDPLVLIGSWFASPALSRDERLKVLNVTTNARHRSEERLWSGSALTTAHVISDIDIFPETRIAYAEKHLMIKNNNPAGAWVGRQQEAIFTFDLPEGSVVTSLSLWVNGREEKGLLTSKQKATHAYNTIVGVETRDPSVVHWKEGNTVTVRVFPCTPDEERHVKIGITTPLREENGNIIYTNVTFTGPNAADATATTRIRFAGSEAVTSVSTGFSKNNKGEYIYEGAYDPSLTFSFKSSPLKPNQYSFNGYHYSIEKATLATSRFAVDRIYLDINKSWTDSELKTFRNAVNQYSFYALYNNELVHVSEANWTNVTASLTQQEFSVFPFYALGKSDDCLVVTKAADISPSLAELNGTHFLEHTKSYFSNGGKVALYNIGTEPSLYIRSLRELRALRYAEGSLTQLFSLLREKQYPFAEEDEQQVTLFDAGLKIIRTSTRLMPEDNAPDHVARLFTYNSIMRRAGVPYFNNDISDEALVRDATEANVVSPVSSLIVLETREDYERFNITDSKNSLQNATKNNSGVVPEPHEWALIAVFVAMVLFVLRDRLRVLLAL
jgi:XrtN system VIT domain protein